MSAKIIDGKALAASIRAQIEKEVSGLTDTPSLAVIMIGNDPASEVYVRNKEKACVEVGINSLVYKLDEATTQEQAEALVKELVARDDIHGVLVQLPLPKHLNEEALLGLIPTHKDVDGFSEANMGKLLLGKECLYSCTPHGVIKLIESEGIDICGKHAVVIGRSNIVGKPIALMLLSKNATVTVCHSKTQNLADICKQADILVVAIGKPKFVSADMVKKGAVVIDVGVNRIDGKLCGDVDFDSVKDVASYITPVPGGVGPMTITMLLYNTLEAYKRANKIDGI